MEKGGWLYIMADRYRGGLYVGLLLLFGWLQLAHLGSCRQLS